MQLASLVAMVINVIRLMQLALLVVMVLLFIGLSLAGENMLEVRNKIHQNKMVIEKYTNNPILDSKVDLEFYNIFCSKYL